MEGIAQQCLLKHTRTSNSDDNSPSVNKHVEVRLITGSSSADKEEAGGRGTPCRAADPLVAERTLIRPRKSFPTDWSDAELEWAAPTGETEGPRQCEDVPPTATDRGRLLIATQ